MTSGSSAAAIDVSWGVPCVVRTDATLVVVDKPAGQLSVPGRGPLSVGSLSEQVEALHPEARTVHRLDMATSGLLLFALGAHWQRVYSRLFAERLVEKRYVALVHGRLGMGAGSSGEIDLPLAADWPNRPRQQVDRLRGKPCLTRWEVLDHDARGAWTRVALAPVTGRTHQLRVHLAAIGHPILGDALYGPQDGVAAPPRLMLHAYSLAFNHPETGQSIALSSPVPF